jgi:hypothetical protein
LVLVLAGQYERASVLGELVIQAVRAPIAQNVAADTLLTHVLEFH